MARSLLEYALRRRTALRQVAHIAIKGRGRFRNLEEGPCHLRRGKLRRRRRGETKHGEHRSHETENETKEDARIEKS
jgi:hypothetical protein